MLWINYNRNNRNNYTRSNFVNMFKGTFDSEQVYNNTVYIDDNNNMIYLLGVPGCMSTDVSIKIDKNESIIHIDAESPTNNDYNFKLSKKEKIAKKSGYDLDNISAEVKNGLLKIIIPFKFKNEDSDVEEIEIN